MYDHTLWNRRIAILGVRLTLASVTMLLGYYKIIAAPIEEQYKWFIELEKWFPIWVLVSVNYYTAYVELIAGFLLFVGFMRDIALYLILSVLVMVTFGHNLEQGVWDMHQLVFRMLMLVPLLLLPSNWDVFRLDICFGLTRRFLV